MMTYRFVCHLLHQNTRGTCACYVTHPMKSFCVVVTVLALACLPLHHIVAALKTASDSSAPVDRIKHIVVLMLENRAFDNIFGYRPGVNGINGTEYNLFITQDTSSNKIYHTPTCPYVNYCDPNHGLPPTTYKIFGPNAAESDNLTEPTMSGFVQFEWENDLGLFLDYCNVMTGFTPDRLPVINALADEFVLFDRHFASVPGPTWPNRLFFMAGTSSGLTETEPWYHNIPGLLFPTRTIFDQVSEAGGTWKVYYNDTPWEMWVETLAHHPEHLNPVDQLFVDAREGTLPDFSYINPRSGINMSLGIGSNDQHPDHDMAVGESFIKDIYESIRASPQWNETLLVITYDEHGGFYDHVPTPLRVPPPGDGETSYPDSFSFDRLGVRIPLLLVSPWLPRGRVQGRPPASQQPAPNSEYELTSTIATARRLLAILNNTPSLTDRDAWAATYEHLFTELSEPRVDCPMHLPDPPPFARLLSEEAKQPINSLQHHIMTVHASLAGTPFPSHITEQGHVSEWLQQTFEEHKTRVTRWKSSKKNGSSAGVVLDDSTLAQLVVQPKPLSTLTASWLVVTSPNTSIELVVCWPMPFAANDTYCLDAGAMSFGTNVTISLCHGESPEYNKDRAQHWVLRKDATLRPFHNQSLCLTTAMFEGNPTPFLDVCGGPGVLPVHQNFGYHGLAAGEGDGGSMYFGDWTANLAVVNITS